MTAHRQMIICTYMSGTCESPGLQHSLDSGGFLVVEEEEETSGYSATAVGRHVSLEERCPPRMYSDTINSYKLRIDVPCLRHTGTTGTVGSTSPTSVHSRTFLLPRDDLSIRCHTPFFFACLGSPFAVLPDVCRVPV